MGFKNIPIISGNVKNGNFACIETSLSERDNEWRRHDQKVAARHAEAARHAKHQRDGLAAFRAALAEISMKD